MDGLVFGGQVMPSKMIIRITVDLDFPLVDLPQNLRCESCFRLLSLSGDEVVRPQARARTLLEGNFTAD